MDKRGSIVVIIAIVIGAIIIAGAIIFVFTKDNSNDNLNVESENSGGTKEVEDNVKTLELSESSFVYLESYYPQENTIKPYCDAILSGDCDSITIGLKDCHLQLLTVKYKTSNFPEELSYFYPEDLQFKGYSNNNELFYKTEDGEKDYMTTGYTTAEQDILFVQFPVDVRMKNEIIICAQVDGTFSTENLLGYELTSNELCLDAFNIEKIC